MWQSERIRTFFRAEVAVPRAECEAIRIPHNGACNHHERKVQIAHHLSDDGYLRRILLAEVGTVGLNDVEELCHHGRDSDKVPWTRCSIEPRGYRTWIDGSLSLQPVCARIHLVGRRGKEKRNAFALQLLAVVVEGARIPGQVLVRPELKRVDEDARRRDDAVLAPRLSDQRKMPGMERSHGGNKAEGIVGTGRATRALHLSYGPDDLHGRSYSCTPAGR